MIEADKRKAIYLLHQEGMSRNEIVRRFGLSRNTVRAIIRKKGEMPVPNARRTRSGSIRTSSRRLYQECDGWIQRVHEKLVEEEGIQVKYSTLTRLMRQLGIGEAAGNPLRPRAGSARGRDATRYHRATRSSLAGTVESAGRQPDVPALLQAALPEVLSRVQPLSE